MPSLASPLDVKHLKKAVEALLTHIENRKSKGKAQLLDESLPVIVQVATATIPEGRSKPYMMWVPNTRPFAFFWYVRTDILGCYSTLKHAMWDLEDTQT